MDAQANEAETSGHRHITSYYTDPDSGSQADGDNHVVVWHNRIVQDEKQTWRKLSGEYQIQTDPTGNYSVLLPFHAADEKTTAWYRRVGEAVLDSLYECKVRVSSILPHLQFSMMCDAVIQEHAESKTFGLAVVCRHHHSTTHSRDSIVGGSIKPKMIKPGDISMRLVSKDFEASILHGEDPCLSKMEYNFRGREFEKQFACRFKSTSIKEGVFGKVIVEWKSPSGEKEILFEFNLIKGADLENKRSKDEDTDKWCKAAILKLADTLHVTEQWATLARQLGFCERELRGQLARAEHPFQATLAAFQARGGSPAQFAQVLDELKTNAKSEGSTEPYRLRSRERTPSLSLGDEAGPSLPVLRRDGSSYSQASTLVLPGRFSPQSSLSSSVSTQEAPLCSQNNPHDEPPDAKRELVFVDQAAPLTPPHTPRKRLMSECPRTPTKRRLLSVDEENIFSFDIDDTLDRECTVELKDKVLWQVAKHVHNKWKALGRNLDVPEGELMCIAHAHKDLKECTYQTLLKWKDMHPHRYMYGALYTALCESGLNSVAQQCCTINETQ